MGTLQHLNSGDNLHMMANREVVVLGAGGHGNVVVATLEAAGFKVQGVFDDDGHKWGRAILGVPVVGPIELVRTATRERAYAAVLGIGDNRTRKQVINRVGDACEWVTVIHPHAYVHPSVRLGAGTVVFAGAVLQPDVVVGEHSIINTGAPVDHDARIGSFTHIAPGAHLPGGVRVGEGALVGLGSAVLPGVSVGEWAVVGAGAVVVRDVRDGTTVVGVPARTVEGD